MHINRINAYSNLYKTFKGEENRESEHIPKKSFVELLQTIDFDEEQSSKKSLLDAIKLKEAEEGAKNLPSDIQLNLNA